jgi:hypothetical protein
MRDEHKPRFAPFVHRQDEHLNAFGEVCRCTTEKSRVVSNVAPGAVPKKKIHVPTWDERERLEARRNGFQTWVHSQARK